MALSSWPSLGGNFHSRYLPVAVTGIYYLPALKIRLKWQILANMIFFAEKNGLHRLIRLLHVLQLETKRKSSLNIPPHNCIDVPCILMHIFNDNDSRCPGPGPYSSHKAYLLHMLR